MPHVARRLMLALGTVAALWSLTAVPASARVVTVPTDSGAEEVSVGLQPRESEFAFDGATVGSFNNPEGNAVVHKNETYAIYWDPTDHYHGDWQHLIDTFFQGLGIESGTTGTVFSVDSQYTDRSNLPASYRSTFRGAYTDTDPYPTTGNCSDPHPLAVVDRIGPENAKKEHTPVCLTDVQLRKELQTFIADHGLQKGMGSIFYLLTPPGVTVCLDEGGAAGHCSDYTGSPESYENSFCSYHSDFSDTTLKTVTTPEADTILYGAIPWTAGGEGDYHLTGSDQTPAYDCQDGGFYRNPTTSVFEQEKAKEAKIESKKEEEEHPKNEEEKKIQAREEAKRIALEGPHEEEPNQPPEKKVGPDGSPDTGLADLIISQIGVQQQSIVTDPLLNGWHDEVGNEVTDECRNFFLEYLGGSATASEFTFAGTLYNQLYNGFKSYIDDAFDLAAERLPYPGVPCMNGIDLVPQFTAPNTVNTGELVGFNGMESDITLNDDIGYSKTGVEEAKYATYKWNFGDGTPEITGVAPGAPSQNSPETSPCELPWQTPCAASTFHSYQYGGKYNVTLTVTDTGGNTASVTEPMTVVGPGPPPPPTPPGGGTGGGASGSGGSGGSVTSSSTPSVPGPIATAAAVSSSLKQVAKSGLVVRYSVNEQVAGRFEVLLESATAHHLGISGPTATNLPSGSPQSLVIGHALLVTTKGGKSSVRIKFSKSVAKHLRRAKKVKLTLRLTAHNADAQNPLFTTVMSTVELHR
jgi:PKD domain-containing protein